MKMYIKTGILVVILVALMLTYYIMTNKKSDDTGNADAQTSQAQEIYDAGDENNQQVVENVSVADEENADTSVTED